MKNRIIGNNSHGNKNELEIVKVLSNKTFCLLNNNLKEFVKFIGQDKNIKINANTRIDAKYEPNTKLKQDFYIYIDDYRFAISCKMGSGNSVHQEKCSDFISYIKNCLNASDEICNDFSLFLWADGTLDGTGSLEKDNFGNIKCRFTSKEFRTRYPEKVIKMQDFLNKNQNELIKRFLFIGRHNSKVDYLYHGNERDGTWISAEDLIKINLNYEIADRLHVGKMSLQSWNVSKKGTSEKKRGQLQVKYSQMENDIKTLMNKNATNINTFFGDKEEYDISKRFNMNKTLSTWKLLTNNIINLSNVYMVKVTNRVVSKLSGKKVFPKSDAYLIRADLSKDYLLQKEYEIDEKDLKNINYEVIKGTGISVKINGSKKYTIQKLTHDSFIKAFQSILDNAEYIFLGLLLYSNQKETFKNYNMLNDLKVDLNDFVRYYSKNMNRHIKFDNIDDLADIRLYSQNYLRNQIKSNPVIHQALFTGESWFDEPYMANYIYLNKQIKVNIPSDFTITTGSGRSKGNYSIEIKPL